MNLHYVYTLDGFWLADKTKKTSFFTEATEFTSADEAEKAGIDAFGCGEFYVLAWVK